MCARSPLFEQVGLCREMVNPFKLILKNLRPAYAAINRGGETKALEMGRTRVSPAGRSRDS